MNVDKTDAEMYINLELNRGVNTIDGQTEHLNYTTRSCTRSLKEHCPFSIQNRYGWKSGTKAF